MVDCWFKVIRRNRHLSHAEMLKRKWFSSLIYGQKKSGHIYISTHEDIQVGKSWGLSQNLSERKSSFTREVSKSYTDFVKVRKCSEFWRWICQATQVYGFQRRNSSEGADNRIIYVRRLMLTYFPPKKRSSKWTWKFVLQVTHETPVTALNEPMTDLRCLSMVASSGVRGRWRRTWNSR